MADIYVLNTSDSSLRHRNGCRIIPVGVTVTPDATHDWECLPMIECVFLDGEQIECWTDEIAVEPGDED